LPRETICAAPGKSIHSGQHDSPNHLSRHSGAVAANIGKDSILGRDAMIEEAKEHFAAGLLALSWDTPSVPSRTNPSSQAPAGRAACRRN
jgi:hypothetical protein